VNDAPRWFHPRALAAAAVLGLLLLLVSFGLASDAGALRYRLLRWQFWALETQFVLLAVLTWLNLGAFVRSLLLRRAAVFAALGASLLALFVIVAAVPRTNRIFYDEHIYQAIGQNLTDLRLAQTCNEGRVEYGRLRCTNGEYNKQPYGYPYLLSLLYRIAGVHEWIAHWWNAVCTGLLVFVVFLLATALFGEQRIGVLSALVLALTPQQLIWSGTAAAEPSAALMTAIAVMAAVAFVRLRTLRALLWTVVTSAFATQFRPESLLVVAVVIVVVSLHARDAFGQASWWWAAGLLLLLSVPNVLHLFAVRGEPWGSSGDRLSLAYFWPNLKVNGLFFLDNARFPVVYTALALVGVARRFTRATLVAVVYFLLFWGVFLFFYAGSYDYGADVRFSLLGHPAAAMLAGLGAAWLCGQFVRWGLAAKAATRAMVSGLVFQFLWFMPQVRAIGEEGWAARADVSFARRASSELPRGSIILTHNPHVFLLRGRNAAQLSLASVDPNYVSAVLPAEYSGGVFVHWNYWCNVADPVQAGFCTQALAFAESELVAEYEEQGYRYAFYKLDPGTPRLLLKAEPK
jgi:hypothetical protein